MSSKAIQYLQKAKSRMEAEDKEFLVLVVYRKEAQGVKTEVEGQVFFRSNHPDILARLIVSVAKQDKGLEVLLNKIEAIRELEREKSEAPTPPTPRLLVP